MPTGQTGCATEAEIDCSNSRGATIVGGSSH